MLDAEFWAQEAKRLYDALFPLILATIQKAVASSVDMLLAALGMTMPAVNWDLVNADALLWAEKYTYDLVSGITSTSQKFLQDELSQWIASGEPLDKLIENLTPMFGPVRAEMIAATEVTRVYSEANILAWTESGVVSGYRFNTVYDDLVCAICEPDNGQIYPLTDREHLAPRHVRCRCFETPILPQKNLVPLEMVTQWLENALEGK